MDNVQIFSIVNRLVGVKIFIRINTKIDIKTRVSFKNLENNIYGMHPIRTLSKRVIFCNKIVFQIYRIILIYIIM